MKLGKFCLVVQQRIVSLCVFECIYVYKNNGANDRTKMFVTHLFISQKIFIESVERTFGNYY